MLGSGCNLQRHCAWAIFAGVGFKFNDFIQAVHRIYRFLQTRQVTIDIVYAESEASVRKELEEKWARYDAMMARMSEIIREYGLHSLGAEERLKRTIGVERQVVAASALRGRQRRLRRGDGGDRGARAREVGLIVTSIPFGTQYEYTPSYNDFGHTDDDAHFWRQMDFLSPSLWRPQAGPRDGGAREGPDPARAGWTASASRRRARSTPTRSSTTSATASPTSG
jgi:hypothetical protein